LRASFCWCGVRNAKFVETYKPDVGARYMAASNTRMRALKALLLAAQAGAIEGTAEVFGEVEDQL
jgi:hypothetical protein